MDPARPMPEPVLIAVPPKGGSFDDVLKRLTALGWVRGEIVAALRRVIKDDKRRVKLEEGLIALWRDHAGDRAAVVRAGDRAGLDIGDIEDALARMVRWRDEQGREQLDYSPRSEVARLVGRIRSDGDADARAAADALHIQVDLTRPGKPARLVFNQLEFSWKDARGVLIGTDHEVTPTYLRKHKRDISLTCYDAFHNTMLDALDTGKVRNWRELMAHLIEANTDVRILGSLGLDDYLGHCVLMDAAMGAQARALVAQGASRRWGVAGDPKAALLKGSPLLIDPQYEEVYETLLDARANGIRFATGPKDIETTCAEQGRAAIYIVRSGSTVEVTPNLCVVGEELITSETIVAVNQERIAANPHARALVEHLQPSQTDHTAAWRTKLGTRLKDKLV